MISREAMGHGMTSFASFVMEPTLHGMLQKRSRRRKMSRAGAAGVSLSQCIGLSSKTLSEEMFILVRNALAELLSVRLAMMAWHPEASGGMI